jgi:hypothetical protein
MRTRTPPARAAKLGAFLSQQLAPGGKSSGKSAAAAAASAELLSLVLQPGAARRGAAGDARVEALLEALTAAPCAFSVSRLGGGPWQVVHTRGALAWRAFTPPGLRNAAVAAQDFDPAARRVVNSVELFGGALRITAEGSFAVDESSARATATPVRCNAFIERGALALRGTARALALPINGKGTFEVCYMDEALRVFRSDTGLAVQVRQPLVQAADAAAAKAAAAGKAA